MNKKERRELEQLVERKDTTFKVGGVMLIVTLLLVWYLPVAFMIAPFIVSIAMIAYGWNRRKYENMLDEE